jgi:hypothetical protein
MPNPVTENPNASTTAVSGAGVTVAIWLAASLGADIPPEIAAALTTVVGAAILYFGKRSRKSA